MPHNSEHSEQIAAYVDPSLYRRMKRIRKLKPRYTLSRQVEACLNAHLTKLEIELGVATKGTLNQIGHTGTPAAEPIS